MWCGALTMYVRGEFVVTGGGYFIRVVVSVDHSGHISAEIYKPEGAGCSVQAKQGHY